MKTFRRVKTEEEFIKEFGKNWRHHDGLDWPESLDKYLGKPIEGFPKDTINERPSYKTKDGSILVSETIEIENLRVITKECPCIIGCEKCEHTGSITQYFPNTEENNPIEF